LDVPSVGGRLMLVDMAGSENIEAAGQTGFEAKMQVCDVNSSNNFSSIQCISVSLCKMTHAYSLQTYFYQSMICKLQCSNYIRISHDRVVFSFE
jgi:hypothetical protein